MKAAALGIGIRIEKCQDTIFTICNVKDKKVEWHDRGGEGVSEITQADASNEQHARRDASAGNGGAKIRLEDDQSKESERWGGGRQQGIAPVIHGLSFVLQEPCQKQNERRLCQFRGL